MNEQNQAGNEIQQTVQRIVSGGKNPFSVPAFDKFNEKISEYIVELAHEALRIAKRQRSDIVDAAHVERASEQLVTNSPRKLYRHIGTLGGIFLGAGVSAFLPLFSSTQIGFAEVMVISGLTVLGTFLVALQIAKD